MITVGWHTEALPTMTVNLTIASSTTARCVGVIKPPLKVPAVANCKAR